MLIYISLIQIDILKFHNTLSDIFNIIYNTNDKVYDVYENGGKEVSEEFAKAVKSNNILMIKIMLKDSMLVDPIVLRPSSMYNKRLRFTLKYISPDEFYDNSKENIEREKEDGFYKDKSQWTKDYNTDLMVELPNSHPKASKKLWDHTAQVVQYIYGGK